VQQFVSTLITYVFDTAIGSNWASFISRLSKLQQHGADHSGEELQDVFSILDYHSAVLDSILEACLLKARHKSAGTVMKDCLETILLLGKLARDTASSTLTYTEASATLLDLYARFEKSMGLLVRRFYVVAKLDTYMPTPDQVAGETRWAKSSTSALDVCDSHNQGWQCS
jgi:hypothetical protein